jgi:hypothetical protein
MAQPIPCDHDPRGCVPCRKARERSTTKRYNDRYRESHVAEISAYNRKYWRENQAQLAEKSKQRRANNLQADVEANRRRRMVLPKPFLQLVAEAGFQCEVCRRCLHSTRACADHDHRTKQFRGALCFHCNVGLGLFSDSAQRLAAAVLYLTSWASVISAALPPSLLTLEERRHSSRHGTLFTRTKAQMLSEPWCGICGTDLLQLDPRQVHIDHNHLSGHSRGLLCGRCNRGLGMFQDSVEVLASAERYLARSV